MKIQALGHVVLRVTNRERAERFYAGVTYGEFSACVFRAGLVSALFSDRVSMAGQRFATWSDTNEAAAHAVQLVSRSCGRAPTAPSNPRAYAPTNYMLTLLSGYLWRNDCQ